MLDGCFAGGDGGLSLAQLSERLAMATKRERALGSTLTELFERVRRAADRARGKLSLATQQRGSERMITALQSRQIIAIEAVSEPLPGRSLRPGSAQSEHRQRARAAQPLHHSAVG